MCPNDEPVDEKLEPEEENLIESGEPKDDELLESESSVLPDLEEDIEPDFSDELAFPTYQRGKMAKAMDATQIYLSEIGFSPLLSAEEDKAD